MIHNVLQKINEAAGHFCLTLQIVITRQPRRRRAAAWRLSRMRCPRALFATSPSVPWESRRVCSCDADTKTAVDKDTVAVSRQNDVGIARRVSLIEPKPVAHEMQQPSDNQLGLGVFAQMRLMSWLRCCGLKVSAMQLRLLRILIKARWGNARSNVLGQLALLVPQQAGGSPEGSEPRAQPMSQNRAESNRVWSPPEFLKNRQIFNAVRP